MNNSYCLYHFGVKGMKWGVWNEETKARRFGYNIKAIKDANAAARGLQKYLFGLLASTVVQSLGASLSVGEKTTNNLLLAIGQKTMSSVNKSFGKSITDIPVSGVKLSSAFSAFGKSAVNNLLDYNGDMRVRDIGYLYR